jgi:hypothetical protein
LASGKPGIVPTEYRTLPRFRAGRARVGSSRELGGSSGSRESLAFLGCRVSRTDGRVSGSLAFPAPPHDLGPSPARISGGFPSRPPFVAEAAKRRPSWPFPLLQSARGNAGTALRWFLLSWDSGPCRRCTSSESTPGSRSSRRTGAAGCRFSFRPRGFAPPRRFSPRWSCGSVAPRNRPRVHRVSRGPTGWSPEGGLEVGLGSRGAFRTLRRVPLVSSRIRITATVAFLSLPSCSAGSAGRSR